MTPPSVDLDRYPVDRLDGAGGRDRLVGVLSYTAEPGVTFSPCAQRMFYGRETAGESA